MPGHYNILEWRFRGIKGFVNVWCGFDVNGGRICVRGGSEIQRKWRVIYVEGFQISGKCSKILGF